MFKKGMFLMTNSLKNGKRILSFVLSFAILAVSLFTGVNIKADATDVASNEGITDTWEKIGSDWYDTTLADNNEAGDDWDSAIIIDSAEELAYLASLNGSVDGKYYKVADGIKAFNMTPKLNLDGDMTPDEVEAALNTDVICKTWWGCNFLGAGFDGNGVIIYGLQAGNPNGSGGLFHKVNAGVTIKNLQIKNSYFKGDSAGALFGCVNSGTGKTITIENVVLTGNVVVSTRSETATSNGGVMFGTVNTGNIVNINNCLVYNNVAKHAGSYTNGTYTKTGYDITYGLFGCAGYLTEAGTTTRVYSNINNSIILDCMPFSPIYDNNCSRYVNFKNVYTNMIGVKVTNYEVNGAANLTEPTRTQGGILTKKDDGKYNIYTEKVENGTTSSINGDRPADAFYEMTVEGAKGEAGKKLMSALDWETVWFVTEGMPTLCHVYHESEYSNIGTIDACQAEICSVCGAVSAEETSHNYTVTGVGSAQISTCGTCGFVCDHTDENHYKYTVSGNTFTLICDCGVTLTGEADIKCADRKTIYWDGTKTVPASTAAGTKDDPVIITSAEELAYVVEGDYASNSSTGYYTLQSNGTPKYFKIADDIGAIVLQPEEYVDEIMALDSAAATQKFFEENASALKQLSSYTYQTKVFCGHFDGNGVTVYGLYQNAEANAGLFSGVDAGASIHNIALKNSYLKSTGTQQVGGIFAHSSPASKGATASGMIWLDSCVVANCYMRNGADPTQYNSFAGVLFGNAGGDAVTVDNCLVYGNDAKYDSGVKMAMVGSVNNNVDGNGKKPAELTNVKYLDNGTYYFYYNMFRNTICMDADVMNISGQFGWRRNDPDCYEGVLTNGASGTVTYSNSTQTYTEAQIKSVTVADLATMDLGDAWLNTATYPELRVFHDDKFTYVADVNDAYLGHTVSCSCGAGAGTTVAHNYVITGEGSTATAKCSTCGFVCDHKDENHHTYNQAGTKYTITCDCGVVIETGKVDIKCTDKKTIYWDGDKTEPASTAKGTKDDPIIINTASELAYLVGSNETYTTQSDGTPKYFEIADDIGAIVLQPEAYAEEIMALDSAAKTQKFFEDEDNVSDLKPWPILGYNASAFSGYFDGNGVTVYGLYQPSTSNAGLFSGVDAGASIHNIALKNSYLTSSATNYQVGGIFAVSVADTVGVKTSGMIWLDGCVVANCYMRNASVDTNRSGVLFGYATGDSVTVDNCLVYGNDAEYGSSVKMAMVGYAKNNTNGNNKKPEELNAKIYDDGTYYYYYNMFRNTICLDANVMNIPNGFGGRLNEPDCYENVLTNGAAGEVIYAEKEWGSQIYKKSQIRPVTLSDLATIKLGDAWFNTATYPELRSFHDANLSCAQNASDAYVGHVFSCSCGAGADATLAHTYTIDGETATCDVCGFVCDHNGEGHYEYSEIVGDCVTDTTFTKLCECGVTVTGTKDDASGNHTTSGEYYVSGDKHSSICSVCDKTFDPQAHTDADTDGVCDVCERSCADSVFDGANITLTDSIAVNYMVDKNAVADYSDLYIKFEFLGKEYIVNGYTEQDGYLVFAFDKVAPHRMTDTICATICGTKDGAVCELQACDYSIQRYCHNILESTTEQDASLRTLLVDMLNYGAQAQIYTDYNTDKLVNADLTDAQKAWGTSGEVKTESDQNLKYATVDNPTVKWMGAGLYLDEEATLRFTIKAESIDNLVVKAECGANTITVDSSEFVKRSDKEDCYYVYIRGINVTQMREVVYLTVYSDETAVSNTITYSVESYADTMKNDNTLKNLLVGMMKYGDAARGYEIAICDHIDNDGETVQYPALLQAGIKEYTCTKCGRVREETFTNETSISILVVGNSYAVDAFNKLYAMFDAAGYIDIDIAVMYRSGCKISEHWTNMQDPRNSANLYNLYRCKDGNWTMTGATTETYNHSIEDILTEKEWDIVVTQNNPNQAYYTTGFYDLGNVIDYIRQKQPNAKIIWFTTWALRTYNQYFGEFDTEAEMFEAIARCVQSEVLTHEEIHSAAPIGTAIMNAKSSYLVSGDTAAGDELYRDGTHLSYDVGYYIAALGWYCHITGQNPYDVADTFKDVIPSDIMNIALESVYNAMQNPYEITQSIYTNN